MFFSDEIYKSNKRDVEQIRGFLLKHGVNYDFPEKTYVIRDKGKIIATGSVDGNILKYFYADDEYKGQGLMTIIYNSLLSYLIENGRDSFFVFTKPKNTNIFKSLGLDEVCSTEKVSLFEGGLLNYKKWIEKVKNLINIKKHGKRGAIVMNCNPMTLGHKYLIEESLKEVDDLIVFIVEEDKSVFPFLDRINIVKEELKHYKNIRVIPGGPYIISQATFPTYFLKEEDDFLKVYTELDGSIFAKKIAKDLEIDIRFLGTEPSDPVTLEYNKSLRKILEKNNIEVNIIERMKLNEKIVSASYVRDLISKGRNEDAFKFLPKSTIDYLTSDMGKTIEKKLKGKI